MEKKKVGAGFGVMVMNDQQGNGSFNPPLPMSPGKKKIIIIIIIVTAIFLFIQSRTCTVGIWNMDPGAKFCGDILTVFHYYLFLWCLHHC